MSDGSLRASDADRQQVIDVLTAAYADGRIDPDEHAERTESALRAKTFGELNDLTADLVPPLPPQERGEPDRVSSVMSTVRREGPWQARRHIAANNFMGTIHLDFTEATLADRSVEISGTNMMGTVVVRVPIGTTVRDETSKVMGGTTSIRNIGAPDPRQPVVLISGTNVMGTLKIRGPKKPLPWGLSGPKALA